MPYIEKMLVNTSCMMMLFLFNDSTLSIYVKVLPLIYNRTILHDVIICKVQTCTMYTVPLPYLWYASVKTERGSSFKVNICRKNVWVFFFIHITKTKL